MAAHVGKSWEICSIVGRDQKMKVGGYHTVREEKQKEPDLWMIKPGFVGSKEVAAEAPKRTKRVADILLQEDRAKWTQIDDWQKVVRAEGVDSPKEAQTEGACLDGAAAPEEKELHQGTDSGQFQPNNEDLVPEAPNSKEGRAHRREQRAWLNWKWNETGWSSTDKIG
jgi:hypothetical protein